MKRPSFLWLIALCLAALAAGCGSRAQDQAAARPTPTPLVMEVSATPWSAQQEAASTPEPEDLDTPAAEMAVEPAATPADTPTPTPTLAPTAAGTPVGSGGQATFYPGNLIALRLATLDVLGWQLATSDTPDKQLVAVYLAARYDGAQNPGDALMVKASLTDAGGAEYPDQSQLLTNKVGSLSFPEFFLPNQGPVKGWRAFEVPKTTTSYTLVLDVEDPRAEAKQQIKVALGAGPLSVDPPALLTGYGGPVHPSGEVVRDGDMVFAVVGWKELSAEGTVDNPSHMIAVDMLWANNGPKGKPFDTFQAITAGVRDGLGQDYRVDSYNQQAPSFLNPGNSIAPGTKLRGQLALLVPLNRSDLALDVDIYGSWAGHSYLGLAPQAGLASPEPALPEPVIHPVGEAGQSGDFSLTVTGIGHPTSVENREIPPGNQLVEVDFTAKNGGSRQVDLNNGMLFCLTDGQDQCLGTDPMLNSFTPWAVEAGETASVKAVFAVPDGAQRAAMACQRVLYDLGAEHYPTARFALPK